MIERLIFARHAETRHNVDGIAQGWSDSDLSDRGRAQVERLAARARKLSPSAIFSSPLPRAVATAKPVAEALGLSLQLLDDLREMHCGQWEGRRFTEIREEDPERYRSWISDPMVPCPEGESFHDVRMRMRRALDQIHAAGETRGAAPMVISHGTAIRIVAVDLLDLPLASARWFLQENAAVNIFERRHQRYLLRCWNDATHCEGEPSAS
ncbi:MAG TPA: histidine phosphatase family protein [Thermoanaerobaculia bacterium]|nr:histidine phosphatase family protein [Thermoanaerobaculia bacterium]